MKGYVAELFGPKGRLLVELEIGSVVSAEIPVVVELREVAVEFEGLLRFILCVVNHKRNMMMHT
jgi:hypothetical protein